MRTRQSYVDCGMKGAIAKWAKEPPFRDRFFKNIAISAPDQCWNWTKSLNKQTGYGKCKLNGKAANAHRVTWILVNGPVPDGMCVCHRCDNRMCCNPAHLFLGTRRDNAQDAMLKGRLKQNPKRGQPRTKLSKLQVVEIRQRHLMGESPRHISYAYPVGYRHILKIVSFKSHSPP